MSQSRIQSALEAATNTLVGGAINWLLVFACVSLIKSPALAASASVAVCTVHSFVRSYWVRRVFARREQRRASCAANHIHIQ